MGLALSLAVVGTLPAADVRSHVRVVLDTSGSMKKNDQDRLAILATRLLADLVQPNTTRGDTFVVLPFDPRWKAGAIPSTVGTPIALDSLAPSAFEQKLTGLAYDVGQTFFGPGIRIATEELETTPGGEYDVRVLVLVTDGLPEKWRDEEAAAITTQWLPRLSKAGVAFYVLAFGPEAFANQGYFRRLVGSTGKVYVDPDGASLLRNMVEIFGRSFGYTAGSLAAVPGTSTVDLEGGETPSRAAVVLLAERPPAPTFELTPPPAGRVQPAEPLRLAAVPGAGYALRWYLTPHPGEHGLRVASSATGQVGVLRPTRLDLAVAPAPPANTQVDYAMAETPLRLRVVVRSPGGARGDVGPVDVSYRWTWRDGEHEEENKWEGVPASGAAGVVTADGREYEIEVVFPENKIAPAKPYAALVEVEARRGEAVVGALRDSFAHPVQVFPRLALAPVPVTGSLGSGALARHDEACTAVAFEVTAGNLPHPERPEYPVGARIRLPAPETAERELREARFFLDGSPLAIEGEAVATAGEWYRGRSLAAEQLLGPHELCVALGRPVEGDPARPIDVELALSILEAPYDDFVTVRPFTAQLAVLPPSFLERWRGPLIALVAALVAGGLLWYGRRTPFLPADLVYYLDEVDAGRPPPPSRLPVASSLTRWLALQDRRALAADRDGRTWGEIRPIVDGIYELRPAPGVKVASLDDERDLMTTRRGFLLEIGRRHRLQLDQGPPHELRLQYAHDPPPRDAG